VWRRSPFVWCSGVQKKCPSSVGANSHLGSKMETTRSNCTLWVAKTMWVFLSKVSREHHLDNKMDNLDYDNGMAY
jgi:hypothetical protein